jgi:hypothetical protein
LYSTDCWVTQVYNALNISGIAPEDLPVAENIKQTKNRLSAKRDEPQITDKKLALNPIKSQVELIEIDLRKELWKYALLVIVQQPNMEMSTTDLIAKLPKYITVSDEAVAENMSRKDSKFSQIVRNLKSHKTSKNNFIYLGYAEDISGGFRATEKGLDFVKKHFTS